MMNVKTKAVVLRSLKYGERQLVVDMFCEQCGRVSFICSVPVSAKGKLKKQLFQPMTLLELEFDHRPARSLQHLRDVRLVSPYASIPFNPHKLSITLFLAEFLYYSTRDEQLNPSLFAYVQHSMEWLDGCRGSCANFHLVFMLRLSRFIGFYPNLENYHPGNCFDLREGAFCEHAPLHGNFLDPREARLIGLLMRIDYMTMHLLRMSKTERNRCIDVLIEYYRLHIPAFPELKSLAVLRELF